MTWLDAIDPRGPLLALRSAADTTGEVQRLMARFEARNNAPDIIREIANSERGFTVWVAAIDALMYRADLPAADREAVVLRLAALTRARYQWVQHEAIALGVGLSPEAIAALGDLDHPVPPSAGPGSPVLTASQWLAVAIADSVVGDDAPGISDDTWAEARRTWGDDGAFDLLYSVAWWGGMVPLLIRMFRL